MSFKEAEIPVDLLINKFIEIDNEIISPLILANTTIMEKRQEGIKVFIEYLACSKKFATIMKDDILQILPVKNYYSEKYILRAKHIRIQWIAKGLKVYKSDSSSINIDGLDIPKYIVLSETFQVKRVLETAKKSKNRWNLLMKHAKSIEKQLKEGEDEAE